MNILFPVSLFSLAKLEVAVVSHVEGFLSEHILQMEDMNELKENQREIPESDQR